MNSQSKFIHAVSSEFGFLAEYGLQPARQLPEFVEFKGRDVSLHIWLGHNSNRIGVEFVFHAAEEIYTLHEVLETVAPDSVLLARFIAVDEQSMKRGVAAVAFVVASKCQRVLTCDSKTLGLLRESAKSERHSYTSTAQHGPTIVQGDRAWERKDLERAIEAYLAAYDGLDRVRRARLAYMQRLHISAAQSKR